MKKQGIEYLYTEGNRTANVKIRLDGKVIGDICHNDKGWCYFPKGQTEGGEVFLSLQECQESLQDDEE